MTSAEAALTWLLDALRQGDDLSLADVDGAFDTSEWDPSRWSIEQEHQELIASGRQLAGFEVLSRSTSGDTQHSARIAAPDGKHLSVTAWVSPSTGKLSGARIVPAPPEGTIIRDAVEDDGPALAELERRSPLRLGEGGAVRVTFDRGDDYFRSARLMEEVTIYVAEVGASLAGVYWGAQQPVRVAGRDHRIFLEMHVRIDPEAPRGGVFWALCAYGRDRYARISDSIAFWVSPENLAVRKFASGMPPWSVQGLRALIPCGGAVGDEVGRWATPDDAPLVADILNACHGRSELFVPYTPQSLADRLGRDPDQYGWGNVRIHGDAVVAVGGDRLLVTRTAAGDRSESRRAHALDHGFRPGAEDDYRRLLRWWAAELAADGTTHLALFTSEGSPTHAAVTDLAAGVDSYDLWTFDIAEPPGTPERGIYVDPVYF